MLFQRRLFIILYWLYLSHELGGDGQVSWIGDPFSENVGRANLPWSLSSLKLATSWFEVSIPSCALLVKFGKLGCEYLGFFPSCSGKSVGLFEPWEPKGRCPFLGKESFLEKWGLGILISSQLASCYHADCGRRKDYLQSLTRNNVFLGNVWRSTDIWCPIKWRRNFSWLEWSKWKTKFFVGAPDIGNNHIWGFWGTNDVAWAAFLPWILFYLWLPVNCDNGISTIQICGNSAAVETLTQGYAGSIRLWHPRAEGMVLSEVAQSRRKI